MSKPSVSLSSSHYQSFLPFSHWHFSFFICGLVDKARGEGLSRQACLATSLCGPAGVSRSPGTGCEGPLMWGCPASPYTAPAPDISTYLHSHACFAGVFSASEALLLSPEDTAFVP